MGTLIAVIVLVASAAGLVAVFTGQIGQRGRAIRSQRGGKPNAPFIASMFAIVVIVAVLIATHNS